VELCQEEAVITATDLSTQLQAADSCTAVLRPQHHGISSVRAAAAADLWSYQPLQRRSYCLCAALKPLLLVLVAAAAALSSSSSASSRSSASSSSSSSRGRALSVHEYVPLNK
jgi:hypothetical protein